MDISFDFFSSGKLCSFNIIADFLYNNTALAPVKSEIDNIFKEVFPSIMGINLSFHIKQGHIVQYKESSPTRIKRAIRNYNEKLMTTDP